MRGLFAAHWLGAIAIGCLLLSIPALAGSGHDHSQGVKAVTSSSRLSASSEAFELAGTLQDGRLILRLSRKPSGAIVRDAQIEVSVNGESVQAEAQPDHSYAVTSPALGKAGPHEIIATINAGKVSDLLVGTLGPVAHEHGDARDHDHAEHNRDLGTRVLDHARNPLIGGSVVFSVALLGIGIALRRTRPASPFAKPLVTSAFVVAAGGLLLGMVQAPQRDRNGTSAGSQAAQGHAHNEETREGQIDMPPERIAAAKISLAQARQGSLIKKLTVTGVIVPDATKYARVPAQVVGTVAEMRKGIGDPVSLSEVIAVISSREVADAKSEYLAGVVNLDLQRTLFERSQTLWDKRVTSEQQFLQVKATYTLAELRADLARQKLSSLGIDAKLVASEAKEDAASLGLSRLRTYEVRAPLAGRIVERKVDVGAPVGKEGDISELYIIADLTTVWVDLAVPLGDLNFIKEGQRITIKHDQSVSDGAIVFVSPMVNADTRSARVIAKIENRDLTWRPGTYISAQITSDVQDVSLRIPRAALQTIDGKQVVFVRTAKGFAKREVALGRSDDEALEVVSGLATGEEIATSNTFLLKADLGKAEAEHSH